jgi:hypothetical protein
MFRACPACRFLASAAGEAYDRANVGSVLTRLARRPLIFVPLRSGLVPSFILPIAINV